MPREHFKIGLQNSLEVLPVWRKNSEMETERIGSAADPLRKCYEAVLMLVMWTVLVALSRVPVTVTF